MFLDFILFLLIKIIILSVCHSYRDYQKDNKNDESQCFCDSILNDCM